MIEFVLDASVTLAWILDDPVPAYAMRVQQALSSGAKAIVPGIWHLEVANVLVVAERRKSISSDDLSFFLEQLEQLATRSIEQHNDFISVRAALTTAQTSRLSAYDGVYLETARARRVPLATLDQKLRSAATRAQVELFG